MKIVCDACQAKYSISDDKVQGKVFKIRCKKCSNIIVVRGGTQSAEAAPAPAEKDTRVYDYGYDGGGAGGAPADDAVWHLVINQEQVGPMTVADVQQRFASGEIDAETFAWREGFGDWLPLSQVDAFSSMVASGGAALPSGGGGQAAVAAMFGGDDGGGTSRNDPADLFAAASSARAPAAHHEEDDGGDLFGSKPAPAAAAASAANTKLRGERNENSVLFSLNNLAQLASNSPAPAPAASSSSSSSGAGHATGAAGGEGSGLIDIRSMASAYLGSAGAAKPAASSGIGSIDDLPVFGGGGFSEPAVIMPTVARSRDNRILYVMIGAVGLLAIAAVIMVVILLKGNKPAPAAVAQADKPTASDKDTKSGDDTKPADKPADNSGSAAEAAGSATPPATTDTAAQGSATQVAANDKQPAVVHNAVAKQPAAPTHTAEHTAAPTHNAGVAHAPSGGSSPPPPKADKAADKTADSGGGCDEVSCVLNNYDGACCQKFRKGGGARPSGGGAASSGGGAPKASDKPDLDRQMISSAIGAIKGRAMACGDKSSAKGMVKVHVKVDASGHISSVSVSQSPDPALGACVAAAVQKASFPATSNGGSFSYPFPF